MSDKNDMNINNDNNDNSNNSNSNSHSNNSNSNSSSNNMNFNLVQHLPLLTQLAAVIMPFVTSVKTVTAERIIDDDTEVTLIVTLHLYDHTQLLFSITYNPTSQVQHDTMNALLTILQAKFSDSKIKK